MNATDKENQMAQLMKITHHKETGEPRRAEVRLTAEDLREIQDTFSNLKRAYDEDDPFGDDRSPLEKVLDEALSQLESAQHEYATR